MKTLSEYFANPENVTQKQYEALRAIHLEKFPTEKVAENFGYSVNGLYDLSKKYKSLLLKGKLTEKVFAGSHLGRKPKKEKDKLKKLIIDLRKKYLSVEDIKSILDGQGYAASETYIYKTIKQEGFGRLPRRGRQAKSETRSAIPHIQKQSSYQG